MENKILADVYRFNVYPNVDADDEYVCVDLDFVPEKIKEQCRNEIKLGGPMNKIKNIDARELFNIYCTDVDCYEVDENEIFKG